MLVSDWQPTSALRRSYGIVCIKHEVDVVPNQEALEVNCLDLFSRDLQKVVWKNLRSSSL
jgi:hypothetical protein